MRETAAAGQIMASDKFVASTLFKETQILQLHQADDRIVIIGLHEIHIGRRTAGALPQLVPIICPATTKLHRILGKTVMPFDNGKRAHCRQAQPVSGIGPHDHK